jgi:prolyl-tRNA editing enzyme YbaK/EbsC (Cys-tRNA(Pro) deacylase)
LKPFCEAADGPAELHAPSGSTRTVEKHRILNTVAMIYDKDRPISVYVLEDRRISYRKVRDAVGAKSIRLACEEEVF